MSFSPFEVTIAHLAYTVLGGFVVIFGLFSLLIKERLYIGEAVIATVVGIAFGPHGANLFSPNQWGGEDSAVTDEVTLEVTRVVIAIGVFAVGVELPKAYMKRHWRSLAFLLGPAMVWGWMIAALLIWGLFPKLNFLSALVIAACVTPTDPILAQAVVGGKFADKHVPAHIRHLLSAESGSNDGAAFPFLYLALYLTLDASDEHAVGEWFYITWLYEVTLGILIGSILGFSVRKVMKFCERKNFIDRQSFVAQYVSLAVLSIGITTLLGSDDLLAAFACGTAFAWDGFFNKATEDSMFSNVIDLLFNCAAFIYIGAIIPFSMFSDAEIGISVWRLFVLAICILLIRRLPIIMALYRFIPDIKTPREAAFVGWFGPMGVGAIFIATLARTKLPEDISYPPANQVEYLASSIQPIVAFLVLTSVLCHGLSIPFFSLSRRVHSISHTWSRSSMDLRNEPAWATHARRIDRGDDIRINRDDDDDDNVVGQTSVADDGTADRGGGLTEKNSHEMYPRTDTDQTRADSGSSGSVFKRGGGERSDVDAMERGEYRGTGDVADERLIEEGEKEASRQEDLRQNRGEDVREEPEPESPTPPLAEYKEGHHLVIERKKGAGEEVEVEVIRNFFDDHAPNESEKFDHPRPLKHKEVDTLTEHIHKSLEHALSAVRSGGAERIDPMGLGMMGPAELREIEAEESEKIKDNEKREEGLAEGTGEQKNTDPSENDLESEGRSASPAESSSKEASTSGRRDASASPRRASKSSMKPPAIFIHARPTGRRRNSIRRKVLAPSNKERSRSPFDPEGGGVEEIDEDGAEEEYGRPSSSHLAPPAMRGRPSGTSTNSSASTLTSTTNLVQTRSGSPTRGVPAIRFADETAPSSDTVPSGLKAYGLRSPSGGNSSLAMHRTSSVQSNASQSSVQSNSSQRSERREGERRGLKSLFSSRR